MRSESADSAQRDRETLTALNREFVESVQKGDAKRLGGILADDFMTSTPDGALLDKAEYLKLVAQPVTIDAPKPAPRMVSTIPIVGNGQGTMPPGMSGMPPATSAPNRVAAADSPWPAPPSTPPAAAAAPPPRVQASSEPKKIHTVTIRADQTGAVPDAASGTAAAGAARAQSRSAPATRRFSMVSATSWRTRLISRAARSRSMRGGMPTPWRS